MATITFPVWMIAPTAALDVNDAGNLGTFTQGPQWLCVKCKGIPHVVAFTILARAEAFAAKLPNPLEYVNAELNARDMRLALEWILTGSVDQILIDEHAATPIAPLLESLKQLPEAGEGFS